MSTDIRGPKIQQILNRKNRLQTSHPNLIQMTLRIQILTLLTSVIATATIAPKITRNPCQIRRNQRVGTCLLSGYIL